MDYTISKLILLLLLTISISACDVPRADFYVSVEGNDQWSGKLPSVNSDKTDGPFKTLAKARDAVRAKRDNMNNDIVVMIKGGTYFLNETVVFGLEDSGKGAHKIVYQSYPEEQAIFTSGVKIPGWKKLDADLPGLVEAAKEKIWVVDVPKNIQRFYTLYDGENRLPRARSASFIPTGEVLGCGVDDFETRKVLQFPQGALRNWPNLQDVEILAVPTANWTFNILGLEFVDVNSLTAKTVIPGTYPLTKQKKKHSFPNGAFWVENVLEALDEPGEWVYNSQDRKIYLWPRKDSPGEDIVIPQLKEFIKVEGQIDFEGPTDIPAKNIVFKGLTFTCGMRDTWTEKEACFQHDWESYDKDNTLVRFRGAENCVVEKCHFRNSGGCAVRLDLHCQQIRVSDNLIENIGSTGILLGGYGAGTKDVNKGNRVINNHINKCGQLYWHCPGIFLFQSGHNVIANNLVHDMPYTGIVISGSRVKFFLNEQKRKRRENGRTFRWEEVKDFAAIHSSEEQTYEGKTPQEIKSERLRSMARTWELILPYLHSRNNLVEKNEVHNVMQKLGDGNGIYLSGTGTGNIIRYNYLHDIVDNNDTRINTAMRTDKGVTGSSFFGNIVYRCASGGVTLKHHNHFENNIIVDQLVEDGPNKIKINRGDSFGNAYLRFRGGPLDRVSVQRNIFYCSGAAAPFYSIRRIPHLRPLNIQDSYTNKNVFYCAKNPSWSSDYLKKVQNGYGIDKNSVCVDPLFVDLEKGGFRLEPNSPALKLGFEQIDVTKIGLTEDFPFKKSVLNSSLATTPKPGSKRELRDKALTPIEDIPSLPRVLLIGDSISIGYTLETRKLLSGKANLHRIPTNGGPTSKGIKNIDEWLGDKKWDIIHFNWGLHDLCYLNPKKEKDPKDKVNGKLRYPIESYEDNLRILVKRLKATGAKLIWASTTPVPEGEPGRFKGDEIKYNAVAEKIMKENGIVINDLHTHALKRLGDIQLPGGNIHYNSEGHCYLARKVAESIFNEMKTLNR